MRRENFLQFEFLRNFIKAVFCGVVSFFSVPGGAVEVSYYWGQPNWPPASTPEQACANKLAWDSNAHPDWLYVAGPISIYVNSYDYKCNIKYKIPGSINFNDGSVRAYRYSTKCPQNTISNPSSGACIAPPVNIGQLCAVATPQQPVYPSVIQLDGSCAPLSRSPTQKGISDLEVCPTSNILGTLTENNVQVEVDYQQDDTSLRLFKRTYNSIDGLWRHSVSVNLRQSDNFLVLTLSDGREKYFSVVNGLATSSSGDPGRMLKVGNVWVYNNIDGKRFSFDVNGYLTRLDTPSGYYQTLTYSGSKVTVADGFGTLFSITEDYKRQPLTFSAPGFSVQYQYDSQGRLSDVIRMRGSQADVRTYHYEDTRNVRLLTGITDERNIRYASWSYDSEGRLVSGERAAAKTLHSYNGDGSTTVTNELGKQTTYRFELIQGQRHVIAIEGEPSASCPLSYSAFIYNSRGRMTSKTDAKGFVTTYTYNDRGLETTRTEATGTPQARTTTTTWHATFNLPLTVTEGSQVTTYTYDAQGRQTSRTQTAL